MQRDVYTIGDVSKILNIPIKALRNYDQMGLEKPFHTNEQNRYRYYKSDQFTRLSLIRYMNKTLRVPLEEIQRIFYENTADNGVLLEFLTKHYNEINKMISDMEYAKKTLAETIEGLKAKQMPRTDYCIYEQYLMIRYVAVKDVYTPLRNITLRNKELDLIFEMKNSMEGNFMCYIYEKALFNRDNPELIVSKIGTFTKNIDRHHDYVSLPDGRYLCCKFKYSEQNSVEAVSKVLEHASLNNIFLSDTAVQFFNRFDLKRMDKSEYVAELQILEVNKGHGEKDRLNMFTPHRD